MKLKDKSLSQLKKDYWKLLSELIRKETPRCEICKKDSTQVHHIIKKSKGNSVYFYRENLIALCSHCHFNLHYQWSEREITNIIIMAKGKDIWDILEMQRNKIVKFKKYELIESIEICKKKLKEVEK